MDQVMFDENCKNDLIYAVKYFLTITKINYN